VSCCCVFAVVINSRDCREVELTSAHIAGNHPQQQQAILRTNLNNKIDEREKLLEQVCIRDVRPVLCSLHPHRLHTFFDDIVSLSVCCV
jgi:hypothetical protein